MDVNLTLNALRAALDQESMLKNRVATITKAAPPGSEEWVSIGGPAVSVSLQEVQSDIKSIRQYLEQMSSGRPPSDLHGHQRVTERYKPSV